MDKIDLLGRLPKAEIESYVFKGIGIDTYPVIDSYNPDLKAFCQPMKNKLNAVDYAKFVDSKVMYTWDKIDTMDNLKEPKLLVLLNTVSSVI